MESAWMCVDDAVFDNRADAIICAALIGFLSNTPLYIFQSLDEYLSPEYWVSTEP